MGPSPSVKAHHLKWAISGSLAEDGAITECAQHRSSVGPEEMTPGTRTTLPSLPRLAGDRVAPSGYGWLMERARRHDDVLDRLTGSQREAVFAEEPRLAVLAGAGAGKTTVLTLRVHQMVESGIDPFHVLVVTFSRRAAQELRERLWRLGIEGVRSGTFHATALELLEVRRAERGQPPLNLLPDRRRSLTRMLERQGRSLPRSAPAALDTEISWAKGHGLTPETYEEGARRSGRRSSISPTLVTELWSTYEGIKAKNSLLDFDDLISEATAALEDPTFAAAIQWRSRHLLVDEFQDVSPSQFFLVENLMTPTSTLFCVGDPNQSIYSFNGADPELLGNLERTWPDLRIITLGDNHRSTPEIVLCASAVLPPRERREVEVTSSTGDLPTIDEHPDDLSEAAAIVARASSLHAPGGRWSSIAVLARTNAQLGIVEQAMERAGIPSRRLAPDLSDEEDGDGTPIARRLDQPETPDAVVLATFHRSKGLEWPHVFVIGASDGLVPHAAATSASAIDEERRLVYVALTRAERTLHVSWARRRDGEEPRAMPERQLSPLLTPMVSEVERLLALNRPTPSDRAAGHIAEMRRAVSAARAEREGGDDGD